MKGRLIKDKQNEIFLLCPNGVKTPASKSVLESLLYDFKNIALIEWTGDETWKSDFTPSMELYPGDTLAFVTDEGLLIVTNPEAFSLLAEVARTKHTIQIDKYLSITDYAKKHNKSREIIKVYCRDNRIPGARKINDNWMIPEDAPYPVDARRQRTPDTLGNVGRPRKKS